MGRTRYSRRSPTTDSVGNPLQRSKHSFFVYFSIKDRRRPITLHQYTRDYRISTTSVKSLSDLSFNRTPLSDSVFLKSCHLGSLDFGRLEDLSIRTFGYWREERSNRIGQSKSKRRRNSNYLELTMWSRRFGLSKGKLLPRTLITQYNFLPSLCRIQGGVSENRNGRKT